MDDDIKSVILLEKILKSRHFEVEGVNSPDRALEKIQHTKFDVSLLDYILPNMYGCELSKKLKEDNPRLKTILLSGYSLIISDYDKLGFDYALQKPIDPIQLIELLHSISEKIAPSPPVYN